MHSNIISCILLMLAVFTYAEELCIDSEDVACDSDINQIRCTVFNSTIQVQEALENCSHRKQLHIIFELDGQFNLTLDTIISGVEQAWIVASENSIVNLEILQSHVNLTFLMLGGIFNLITPSRFQDSRRLALVESNFFEFFPSMEVLILEGKFTFDFFPSFTSLRSLNTLIVNLDQDGNRKTGFNLVDSFNGSIIRGLGNLGAISWTGGRLGKITSTAFEGVSNLKSLTLSENLINAIEANAFDSLTKITNIQLNNNIIQSVAGPVFNMSTRLKILELSNNPFFPLESLRGCNAANIFLNNNGYETLIQSDFQSLTNRPVVIEMVELLNCNCSLKWTSEVKEFGIMFKDAFCKEPRSELGKQIQFASYNNCECENENVSCPFGQSCIVNETGAYCICPLGFMLSSITSRCEDVNECREMGEVCQHICNNTEGSYKCSCNQGYELTANGHDCEDINECLANNGGCGFACLNTEGGHMCVCRDGSIINEFGDCLATNVQREQVSVWGVVVSIILFLVVTLVAILLSLYGIWYCLKWRKNKGSDKTVRSQVNPGFSPTYVNTDPESNPEIQPYLIVQGAENGLNIQTNNWAEERNRDEGDYYTIS